MAVEETERESSDQWKYPNKYFNPLNWAKNELTLYNDDDGFFFDDEGTRSYLLYEPPREEEDGTEGHLSVWQRPSEADGDSHRFERVWTFSDHDTVVYDLFRRMHKNHVDIPTGESETVDI